MVPREASWALALRAASAGAWLVDFARGEQRWSAELFDLYGVPPAPGGVLPLGWAPTIPEEERRRLDAFAQDACQRRLSEWRFEHAIDHPLRGRRSLLVSGRVEFDDEGRARRMMGISVDVTDRKQGRDEMRALQDRHAFLVELSDAIRTLKDPAEICYAASGVLGAHLRTNRVLYADIDPQQNATVSRDWVNGLPSIAGRYEMPSFGAQATATLARGDTLVINDIASDREVAEPVRAAFRAIGARAMVVIGLIKEGRWVATFGAHSATPRVWTDAEIALVHDTAERTWAAVERAQAEEALARALENQAQLRAAADDANRAKDEFLAILGHELRNPLTPILTALALMRTSGKKAFLREREILERQARHLAGLVDDLLDMARITHGKVKLSRKAIEVDALVADAVEIVKPLMESRRHKIAIDVPAGLLINVDPTRMVQVMVNLLTNAAKYTSPGGHVLIEAAAGRFPRQRRACVVLRVRDDGSGISSDILPEVFSSFRQGRQSPDRPHGGLGLGLAIVKNLVERHGGTVSAASAGQGRGSEFTLRLPTARRSEWTAPKPRPRPRRSERAVRKRRILVVDDNRDIADVMAQMLRRKGYEVETAYDGYSGLDLAMRFQPSVALLDIGLPGMDGYALARRFRHSESLEHVRLIAVTGYGQVEDRRQAAKAGFAEHITKPFDFDRLEDAISAVAGEALGAKRAERRKGGGHRAA